MRILIISIVCCFILTNCSKVETAVGENTQTYQSKEITTSPMIKKTVLPIEEVITLKPITSSVRLNSKQNKNLNESLPPKVREILEKAEKLEILAEVLGENDPDSMGFYPNRRAIITDEKDRKEVLETFYLDVSAGLTPSACYIPHHGIRATYKGKTVEVEICYQCHLFFVKSPFGKFDGGLAYENHKFEDVLNHIIQKQGVEIK